MIIKKKNTLEKYSKIFSDIETLVVAQKVASIWDACTIVAKKWKMAVPSVYAAYYNFKKARKA